MMPARGQVVLVDFPFSGGGRSKLRPALVVQNDREPTQVFVELESYGQQTGLRVDSIVNCVNLFTLEQSKILRELGSFPASLMAEVDAALKAVFGLS